MREATLKVFDDFDHSIEEARRSGGEQAAREAAERRRGALKAALLWAVVTLPLSIFRRR